jgi:hypothetical protein
MRLACLQAGETPKKELSRRCPRARLLGEQPRERPSRATVAASKPGSWRLRRSVSGWPKPALEGEHQLGLEEPAPIEDSDCGLGRLVD